MSRLTTQQAEKLLAKGWILKQHKNPFYQHSYYIFDVNNKSWPRALYINKAIATALQKKGHKMHTHSKTTGKV